MKELETKLVELEKTVTTEETEPELEQTTPSGVV